jgi:hypothetical protein
LEFCASSKVKIQVMISLFVKTVLLFLKKGRGLGGNNNFLTVLQVGTQEGGCPAGQV